MRSVLIGVLGVQAALVAGAKKPRVIPEAGLPSKMAHFEAAKFKLGGDEKSGAPQEIEVSVQPFSIDKTAVTNAQFKEFIRATKYKTEAEKFGWSFVLEYLASEEVKAGTTQTVKGAEHWLAVENAWWRQPEGAKSGTKSRSDHPVVHISWNDARNYCKWARKRLPSEAEWEWAARDGKTGQLYPWGDHPNGGRMNVWEGSFPKENSESDGYGGTAPATEYEPSPSKGMHNMLGNVWEWTTDLFAAPPAQRGGPPPEQQFVLKGGSYLDSIDGSANHKVTVATRMGNTADSGGGNTGFRCAKKGKYKGPASFKPKKVWKEVEAVRPPPPPPPGSQGRGAGGRGGGMPAGMDQELLQKIAAEKGVEGLQEYLAQSGSGARVMTPAQLQKMSDKRKILKEEMAKMERGEMPSEEIRRQIERGEL